MDPAMTCFTIQTADPNEMILLNVTPVESACVCIDQRVEFGRGGGDRIVSPMFIVKCQLPVCASVPGIPSAPRVIDSKVTQQELWEEKHRHGYNATEEKRLLCYSPLYPLYVCVFFSYTI